MYPRNFQSKRHGIFRAFLVEINVYKPTNANKSHPAMNANPPKGVIAPNQRFSVSTKPYKLPENSTVPATNAHPAHAGKLEPGHCPAENTTPHSPATWYI